MTAPAADHQGGPCHSGTPAVCDPAADRSAGLEPEFNWQRTGGGHGLLQIRAISRGLNGQDRLAGRDMGEAEKSRRVGFDLWYSHSNPVGSARNAAQGNRLACLVDDPARYLLTARQHRDSAALDVLEGLPRGQIHRLVVGVGELERHPA